MALAKPLIIIFFWLASLNAWANDPNITTKQAQATQQVEFLAFIEFLGQISELEETGVNVDQLLANPSSPQLPMFFSPKPMTEQQQTTSIKQ